MINLVNFWGQVEGAPCSSKQENEWLARDFLPKILIALPPQLSLRASSSKSKKNKQVSKARDGKIRDNSHNASKEKERLCAPGLTQEDGRRGKRGVKKRKGRKKKAKVGR